MQIRPICINLSEAPTTHDSLIEITDCIIMVDRLKSDLDRDLTPLEVNLLAEMISALSIVRCAKKYGFDYRITDDDDEEVDLFIYQKLSEEDAVEGHEIN